MVTTASLDTLRSKLPADKRSCADVRRVRPNIVVSGALRGHEEDLWQSLSIGDNIRFHVSRQCTRCRLTTVDPDRGVVDSEEPLSTLRRYRAPLTEDGRRDITPVFGVQACHEWKANMGHSIAVGDSIEVLALREPLEMAPEKPLRVRK